ncbi:MAG: HAD family hydrolase [bacterium]|nr:HAD family hydrolase [bacterium]
MKTRAEAFALLSEYTKNPSLINHCLSVEAAMRWHAQKAGCSEIDIERWGLSGLLHDFDYEMFPEPTSPNGHPYKGNKILKDLGYDEEITEAIMGHALYTGVSRNSQMAKTLFAVDELSGLVTASTLVRPDRSLHTIESKSVLKKMKDKHFAAGCNREDIRLGAQELGIELPQLIDNVIAALREIADQIGLAGK